MQRRPPTPPVRTLLSRAWRLRCPVCGQGRVFERGLRRAQRCGACDWKYERGDGHWVGGSEVHAFVTFGVGCLLMVPVAFMGFTTEAMAGALAVHTLFSIAFFRPARAIFLALDYLIDPSQDGGRDEGGGGSSSVAPRPRGGRGRGFRRQPAPLQESSRRPRDERVSV